MGRRKNARQATQYNTIKVRLYPTPEQTMLFQKTFGCCRYIWNRMLSDQERFYQETGAHFIPTPAKYKKDAPFLTEVDNQALTQEYNKLAQAFRNFFRNPDSFGHPRFKRKKDGRNTFAACNQISGGSATLYITENAVRMTKAGLVRAVFPRRPRSGWQLRRITVERTPTGKYYGCLLYACPVRPPEPVDPTEATTVGLNYSVARLYVTDSGEAGDPPRRLQQSQDKLAALQRRLCRMEKGSKHYQEAVQKYRLLYEHIANQRRDFLHKESHRIANEWDAVCVRSDSQVTAAKAVGGGAVFRSGFGMFREMLRYKLERQGKQLLTVGGFSPTARACSVCGRVNLDLSPRVRQWTCPFCGAEHRRGVNAAANIKTLGLGRSPAKGELAGAS